MKKITIILTILAASFSAVSCLREQDFKESPLDENYTPLTINAIAEPLVLTKTEMVYKYDVVWSQNDKIYVTDGTAGDTFTLACGAGQTDGTFTQDHQIPLSGDIEAFYPSTMVDGESLLWPALQTNSQTVPMYCTKSIPDTPATFRMSTLGAVLQLVLSTEAENIVLKSIEIRDDNLTMSGAFEVVDGKAILTATDRAGITLDLGTGVNLGVAARYFNIAVPAGEYSGMTLVFTTTKGSKCTMHSSTLLDIGHGTVNRITLAPKNFVSNGIPEEACVGKFSIGAGKQVVFSHGNLRFTVEDWLTHQEDEGTWCFYANQYDCEYYKDYPGEVSLLNWGYHPSYTVNDNFTGRFPQEDRFILLTDCEFPYENDWGSVVGDGKTWRTLSKAEWQYLLNDRDNASGLYRLGVTVAGLANCVVLAPDSYNGTIKASYDAEEWKLAEADGVVCLPSAGYAAGGADRNAGTATPGSCGYYWTSTAEASYRASGLTFDGTSVSLSTLYHHDCYSIRLVADVPVSVSGLSLSSEALSMQVGEETTLQTIFTPAEATNRNVTWASSNTSVATVSADGVVKALAPGEARISARARDGMYIAYCDVTVFQASVFSVSATRTVYFSTGNLRMRTEDLLTSGTETWSVYDRQYDYEDYSVWGSPGYPYELSLFNWGCTSSVFKDLTTPYATSAMFGNEVVFPNKLYDEISYVDLNWVYDWGSNIGSGFEWRTLTADEWSYLLEGRSGASRLHRTDVRVCGVNFCLVLAPDNFEGTISSSYSISQWAEAEAAGCICLPPAGYGDGGQPVVSSYTGNKGAGYYWTATSTSSGSASAYIMKFNSDGCSVESALKSNCYSVRLVKNGPASSDASVESISLDQTAITVAADKRNIKLNAIVSPVYATNKHVIWSSSNVDVATVDPDGCLSTYNPGTATITATTENGGKTASCVVTCIEGLPGVFTVGPQTTVRFSFGNLYHDPTWDFKFEEHQYDSPSEWTADHIGHFFWSRNGEVAILQQYSDQSRSEDDILFTNSTLLLPNEDLYIRPGYRALSMDEWSYLLGSRPNAAGLYKCGVNVCGKKNCLILAPDDYVGTIQESYDETSWQNAEYAGLVCLPAAGYRNSGVSSKVSHYGSVGYYWTSSAYQDNSAYAMTFTDDDLYFDFTESRNVDHAIRLVHNVTTPQYTVTVPQNIVGGSVSVNGQNAIPGETIIVTATSADGYQLVALTYNGIDIMETREFVMPPENVTISATFEQISRDPVTDVLTAANFTATGSSYVAFSGVKGSSGAEYAGISAKDGSGNIQLNSKNNYGIVSTTSGGKLKSVKITVGSGDKTVNVYAKSTAYTSAADLYNSETLGTLVGSTSETGTINVEGDYSYVGIRSASGAVYLSSIEITWE